MAEAQKAAAPQQAAEQQWPSAACSTRSWRRAGWRRIPAARERGKDLVKEFVAQVLQGAMTVSRDAEAMINARIAQIDHLISIQLNEILHHPAFQKLEGTWRGLKYLMDQSETSDMLKIKVLNVTKKELLRDLQRAPEFDQSALFKKVYEEEYGVFGGAPFAALIGRLRVRQAAPEDIELLEKISQRGGGGARAVPDRRRLRNCSTWTASPNLARRAIWGRSSIRRSTPSGRASGRARIRATWAVPAAHPDAPALRQGRRARWRGSTTKREWTAPITPSICGATRRMRWARG